MSGSQLEGLSMSKAMQTLLTLNNLENVLHSDLHTSEMFKS